MEYSLSIVIPVWNKFNFTHDCLRDLMLLPDDHEIIVVDNGNTDETQARLTLTPSDPTKLFSPSEVKIATRINYQRLATNLGFAQACNRGYKVASAPNVLFLNNDIRVRTNHIDWTRPLIEAANAGKLTGPTIGHLNQQLNFVREDDAFSDGTLVDYLSGWCLAGSKKVFDKLVLTGDEGPFSSEFGLAYFEDTDLSMRATEGRNTDVDRSGAGHPLRKNDK